MTEQGIYATETENKDNYARKEDMIDWILSLHMWVWSRDHKTIETAVDERKTEWVVSS